MTTTAACHRHDISDRAWAILEPILPGGPGKVGRPALNNRRFSNGAFLGSWRWRSLARPAIRLRTLGLYLQSLPQLAERRRRGATPEHPGQRPRPGVADD